MEIMDDIIYQGTIEGMGQKGNAHWVKLTEESNVLACWEERYCCEQLLDDYPKLLWHMPKWRKNDAIERAVFAVEEIRHEKYEGGHAD
jgi:hypothetical protein